MIDFSIIILTYRSSDVITKNINSILVQKMPNQNYEIILINDKSDDDTDKVLKLIATKNNKIRLFILNKRYGNGYCKNLAIEISKGRYLFFFDSHLFLPNKNTLAEMYTAINKTQDLVGVCGNYVSENDSDYNLCRDIRRFMVYGKNSQDLFLQPNKFIPFSIVISVLRKKFLTAEKNFPDDFVHNAAEDTCFQINQHKQKRKFLYLSSAIGYHSHNANFYDAIIKLKRELLGYTLILKKFSNDKYFNDQYIPSFFSFPFFFYISLFIVLIYNKYWPLLLLAIYIEGLLLYPIMYYRISFKIRLKAFFYCLLSELLKLPIIFYYVIREPSQIFVILKQLFFWEINKIKYIYENRLTKPRSYKITTS